MPGMNSTPSRVISAPFLGDSAPLPLHQDLEYRLSPFFYERRKSDVRVQYLHRRYSRAAICMLRVPSPHRSSRGREDMHDDVKDNGGLRDVARGHASGSCMRVACLGREGRREPVTVVMPRYEGGKFSLDWRRRVKVKKAEDIYRPTTHNSELSATLILLLSCK